MTDRDPFASLTARRWYENVLDVGVPAAAAILTAVVLVLLTR